MNVLIGNKQCLGHIIVLSDVTDKKKSEEQVRLLKNIFGRVLRHNIRNEINIIKGNADIIQKNCSLERNTHIESIDNSISDLLNISKKAQSAEKIIEI